MMMTMRWTAGGDLWVGETSVHESVDLCTVEAMHGGDEDDYDDAAANPLPMPPPPKPAPPPKPNPNQGSCTTG